MERLIPIIICMYHDHFIATNIGLAHYCKKYLCINLVIITFGLDYTDVGLGNIRIIIYPVSQVFGNRKHIYIIPSVSGLTQTSSFTLLNLQDSPDSTLDLLEGPPASSSSPVSCFTWIKKIENRAYENQKGKVSQKLHLSFDIKCSWEVAIPASLRLGTVLRKGGVRSGLNREPRGCAVASCAPVGNHAWGHGLQVLHLFLRFESSDRRSLEDSLDRSLHPFPPWPWTLKLSLLMSSPESELFPPLLLVFRRSEFPNIWPVISEPTPTPVHKIPELSQLLRKPCFQLKLKIVECVLALVWYFVSGRVAS